MNWLINVNAYGANSIRHKNSMPVTSGMEYEIKDNGDGSYILLSLSINGKELENEKEYSLTLFGLDLYISSYEYCDSPLPQWLMEKREEGTIEGSNKELLIKGIEENGRIIPPSKYIKIK